jgi:predicted O-linked N-acetylglucosamine transferase (SPINDLY family)
LKQTLKENKKNSKLFNNEIYTKNLEDALEKIHLSFTLGKKLENIYL